MTDAPEKTGIPLADALAVAHSGPATDITLHVRVHTRRIAALDHRDAIMAALRDLGAEWLPTEGGTDVYLDWHGRLCPDYGRAVPVDGPGPRHTCPSR